MKPIKIVCLLSAALLVSACTSQIEEPDENESAANLTPVVNAQGTNANPTSPAKNEAPTGGIQNHELRFAVSADGDNWKFSSEEAILTMASVPNLLLLKQAVGGFATGTLISHFVDASEMHDWGEERIGYITSTDNGQTWSDRALITIENMPAGITAVDPCVVQLADGRLRLYFFDFSANKNLLAGEATDPTFYSAVSEDGATFAFEGKVYTSNAALITDPEVLWYKDRWLLYNPVFETAESMQTEGGQIQISESTDGTDFTYITSIDFAGIPGTLLEGDTISLFGCDPGGITRITSNNGIDFDLENKTTVLQAGGCDPDPVQLPDGSYAMVTKSITMNK